MFSSVESERVDQNDVIPPHDGLVLKLFLSIFARKIHLKKKH